MDGFETYLELYGLPAVFVVMLTKAIGVPVPIPADLIMLAASSRVAEGKMVLWQAFTAILVAQVAGGAIQFMLARGIGRKPLYRFGRYLGLTAARLDAAAEKVRHGGPIGIGVAILTPGIRAASVAACGLAALPLRTFLPGLVLGSTIFLALHFLIGFVGAPVLSALADALPLPWLAGAVVLVLALGLAAWFIIRRRQRPEAASGEVLSEALEAWHEATCPVCLALGATSRVAAEQPA